MIYYDISLTWASLYFFLSLNIKVYTLQSKHQHVDKYFGQYEWLHTDNKNVQTSLLQSYSMKVRMNDYKINKVDQILTLVYYLYYWQAPLIWSASQQELFWSSHKHPPPTTPPQQLFFSAGACHRWIWAGSPFFSLAAVITEENNQAEGLTPMIRFFCHIITVQMYKKGMNGILGSLKG